MKTAEDFLKQAANENGWARNGADFIWYLRHHLDEEEFGILERAFELAKTESNATETHEK